MQKLDRHTVNVVQLTAPGACETDADELLRELQEGRIFSAFTKQEREVIWIQLLAVSTDSLIPSLHTFFEDARYFQGPVARIKRIVKTLDATKNNQLLHMLKHSVTGVNQRSDFYLVQVSSSSLEGRVGGLECQVELSLIHI